jgi:hypothetical protein
MIRPELVNQRPSQSSLQDGVHCYLWGKRRCVDKLVFAFGL